jgi:hypothetical protein
MSRKIPAAIGTASSGLLPQAVEVEDRERAEDHESSDGVDDVLIGDRDEGRDEPESTQAQQRPEVAAEVGAEAVNPTVTAT